MAKPRVIFRDALGRFMRAEDRYKPEVAMVQAVRNREYIILAERMLKPDLLVQVLNQREFESLPEALFDRGTKSSTAKYKAWDIANQIDQMKGIRRKDMKYTVVVMDGKQKREISFYHRIKRNTAASYDLFRRINQEIGLEGFYIYRTAAGKILADRTGKKVRLVGVKVEEIQ